MSLVVENRVQGWLTGLPVGAERPTPPVRTALDASPLRAWIGPLALILATPALSIAFWIACAHHEGSLLGYCRAQRSRRERDAYDRCGRTWARPRDLRERRRAQAAC